VNVLNQHLLLRFLLSDIAGITATLQRHYAENSKQIFPEMKLRGVSPRFYIHVSVSDLYITTIGLPILLQENIGGPIVRIYKTLTDT
jgi:hypothetical protein